MSEIELLKLAIEGLKKQIYNLELQIELLKNKQEIHYHYHYNKEEPLPYQPFYSLLCGGTGTLPDNIYPSNFFASHN